MKWPHQNIFPVTYKVIGGRNLTRGQFEAVLEKRVQRKLAKEDAARKYVDSLPDGPYPPHSFQLSPEEIRQPTRRELEAGVPHCCGEELRPSKFDQYLWYCYHCRKNRVR